MSSPESPVTDPASNTAKLAEAATKTMNPPQVYIVDPETSSVDSYSLWDDEQGIMALRRYYALRDEAEDARRASVPGWIHHFLSLRLNVRRSHVHVFFVLTTLLAFDPPECKRCWSIPCKIMDHFHLSFGCVGFDHALIAGPHRTPRTVKTSFTSSSSMEHLRATIAASLTTSTNNIAPRQPSPFSNALQQITINPNVPAMVSMESKGCITSPDKPKPVFGLSPRACVASGWSKRSTGRNGLENKENSTSVGNISIGVPAAANVSQGTMAM